MPNGGGDVDELNCRFKTLLSDTPSLHPADLTNGK
jgi:hypothetical protein